VKYQSQGSKITNLLGEGGLLPLIAPAVFMFSQVHPIF
jgi:hypothetical protein